MTYNIDRLYVIAGMRGIGKSTFLANPGQWIDVESLPEPLQRIADDKINIYVPSEIFKCRRKKLGDAVLHVDLMVPTDFLKEFGPDAYQGLLLPEMFEGWKGLECIQDAKEVHFLTLFAPRQIIFRRWLRRASNAKRLKVDRNVVTILGDTSDDAAPLRALYQAWVDYVNAFQHQSHAGLDVSGSSYHFHDHFSSVMITDK